MSDPSLSGWGRQFVPGQELRSEDLDRLTRDAVLTRGLGRSYGDSSLPPGSRPVVVATPLADRILSFDDATGRLRAEAGYSLHSLYHDFLARGWFTPVTPGTQFVTLGGMVAGDIIDCSRSEEPELFRATIGGMGLTGHILEIELQLSRVTSPWIWGEMLRVANIDEYLDVLKA